MPSFVAIGRRVLPFSEQSDPSGLARRGVFGAIVGFGSGAMAGAMDTWRSSATHGLTTSQRLMQAVRSRPATRH